MSDDAVAQQPARRQRGWPRFLRAALVFSATLVALLPLPVTWFGLLPAYRMHARFLLFYAPVVCVLLLAYLFYVRDWLARQQFADVLDPLPEPDGYYGSTLGESIRRLLRRLRGLALAALPVVLLAASFYCLARYTVRLNRSIDLVMEAGAPTPGIPVPATRDPTAREAPEVPRRACGPEPESARAPDCAEERARVLAGTRIGSIPLFIELTALYIGIFAAATAALALVALKELARQAIGLSEQELVFRAWKPVPPTAETPHPLPEDP